MYHVWLVRHRQSPSCSLESRFNDPSVSRQPCLGVVSTQSKFLRYKHVRVSGGRILPDMGIGQGDLRMLVTLVCLFGVW